MTGMKIPVVGPYYGPDMEPTGLPINNIFLNDLELPIAPWYIISNAFRPNCGLAFA
jgi:hypothetical protein